MEPLNNLLIFFEESSSKFRTLGRIWFSSNRMSIANEDNWRWFLIPRVNRKDLNLAEWRASFAFIKVMQIFHLRWYFVFMTNPQYHDYASKVQRRQQLSLNDFDYNLPQLIFERILDLCNLNFFLSVFEPLWLEYQIIFGIQSHVRNFLKDSFHAWTIWSLYWVCIFNIISNILWTMAIVLGWAHDVLALHGETLSTKYSSINL